MLKIAHASIDENGKIVGGKDGDQSGKEVCIRNFYKKTWNVVIRPKDKKAAARLARKMKNAALNPHVGYNQNRRMTFYNEMAKVAFKPKYIENDCACDCSSLVAACLIAVGCLVSKYSTTRTLKNECMKQGGFEFLTDARHLNGDDLKVGDILLSEGHHVAVVIEV